MKITKAHLLDFTVLILRWYLAYYMADYGWSKLTGHQFGSRSLEVLNTPLKDVSKFNIAWYLFSLDKTFNIVVGLSQIAGAILIVINRTVLIGALFLIPILVQIFLIDITFTTEVFGAALPLRLAFMLICDFFILYYYKEKILCAWQTLTIGATTKFKYKWWVFLLLPILGLLTDFVLGVLTIPIKFLIDWISG